MFHQATALLSNAGFFPPQASSLLAPKAEEQRQIESVFNAILNQFSEPLSSKQKPLSDAVAKVKSNVLSAFAKKDSKLSFSSCMNLANETKYLIEKLLNNKAIHRDIIDFKSSFSHQAKQERLFGINLMAYTFIGLCVGLSPLVLGTGLPVLIAAGAGLALYAAIASVSIYQYRAEPYLQIANAARKFLDGDEEAIRQGLASNEEYQQLELLFGQLFAHRSKKLSTKQQKLLDVLESLKKEIVKDFTEGRSINESLATLTRVKGLVDKIMNHCATKEDLAAFESKFAGTKKTILALNLASVTMLGGCAAIGFSCGVVPGIFMTATVLVAAIAYAAICAYLYYSNPEVQIAQACRALLNDDKEYHEEAVLDDVTHCSHSCVRV